MSTTVEWQGLGAPVGVSSPVGDVFAQVNLVLLTAEHHFTILELL